MKRIWTESPHCTELVAVQLFGYNYCMDTLTGQIADAIERSDLSRLEISERSGVDPAVLSRLINGRTEVTVRNAHRIADALGYEIRLIKSKKKGG